MAKPKNIDFQKAMENKVILKGLVKTSERLTDQYDNEGNPKAIMTVVINSNVAYMRGEDAINYPYSKSFARLVGDMVSVCVKEIVDDKVYVSMKLAKAERAKDTIELLEAGESVEGIVRFTTPYGAYITTETGVDGFLKNSDFSNDGTEVREVYPKMSKIKVRKKGFDRKGQYLFLPETKHLGTRILTYKNIRKGQAVEGKVVSTYPDRYYINIDADLNVMCFYNPSVPNVQAGDRVLVKITKIMNNMKRPGEKFIRGAIIRVLPPMSEIDE